MSTGKNANNAQEEKALEAINKAIHEYMTIRGDIGDGKVLLDWGVITSSTRLIDGEPAYNTASFQGPGGIPTHTWIGMLVSEKTKWLNYFTEVDDDDG